MTWILSRSLEAVGSTTRTPPTECHCHLSFVLCARGRNINITNSPVQSPILSCFSLTTHLSYLHSMLLREHDKSSLFTPIMASYHDTMSSQDDYLPDSQASYDSTDTQSYPGTQADMATPDGAESAVMVADSENPDNTSVQDVTGNWWLHGDRQGLYPRIPMRSQLIEALVSSAFPGGIYLDRNNTNLNEVANPPHSFDVYLRLQDAHAIAKKDLAQFVSFLEPIIREKGSSAQATKDVYGRLLDEALISLQNVVVYALDWWDEDSLRQHFANKGRSLGTGQLSMARGEPDLSKKTLERISKLVQAIYMSMEYWRIRWAPEPSRKVPGSGKWKVMRDQLDDDREPEDLKKMRREIDDVYYNHRRHSQQDWE
ncbi:hypothetical protein F4778DRAFT_45614 [Xylariomycetidae sp. FL2044]|nr:hypothetical protein F4778DRAFT_45614 [Xylariomycetidae sp. FL2044]